MTIPSSAPVTGSWKTGRSAVTRWAATGPKPFADGIRNSCNPVFIDIGLRLGADRFYEYFRQFGLMELTGVDLPGEAQTIMHKKENVGLVELATISFGQSFQVTPIQMAATASALINGGRRVTPHLGVRILDSEGKKEIRTLNDAQGKRILSEETSAQMRALLESVVAEGSGSNAYVEGYRIGGKTATSQTLPRSAGKIHFFFSRIRACRRSADPGDVRDL